MAVQLHQQQVSVVEASRLARQAGLFAILDSCDLPAVPAKVRELGPDHAVCLYGGQAAESLGAIAPYLVAVDPEVFDWISQSLWSEPWGIFVRSERDLQALRSHWRRFLLVESPDGEEWYFRFYDPRVIGTFLATCTASELDDFLGPVSLVAFTDPETYAVRVLSRGPVPELTPRVRVRLRMPVAGVSGRPADR